MLIIVEGVDRVGKTTVIRELSQQIFAPVYKPVGTPLRGLSVQESQAEDRGAWGVATLLPHDVDMIFDRAFPSEWVYGRTFDRSFDERQVWELDEQVSKLNHVALLVCPTQAPVDLDDMDKLDWDRVSLWYRNYVERSKLDWVLVPQWPKADHMRAEIARRRKVHGPRRVTLQEE